MSLECWDGQRLRQLAYFDRLYAFLRASPQSSSTLVEVQHEGNTVFATRLALPKLEQLAAYLELLWKARKVAERCGANPVWSVVAFDADTMEAADELYEVFFEGGLRRTAPNLRLVREFDTKSLRGDVLRRAANPCLARIEGEASVKLLDEVFQLGRLIEEYTDVSVRRKRYESDPPSAKARGKLKRPSLNREMRAADSIEIEILGTERTVKSVRMASSSTLEPAPKG